MLPHLPDVGLPQLRIFPQPYHKPLACVRIHLPGSAVFILIRIILSTHLLYSPLPTQSTITTTASCSYCCCFCCCFYCCSATTHYTRAFMSPLKN